MFIYIPRQYERGMDIDIPKRTNDNIQSYSPEEFEIAKKFSEKIRQEMGPFLKAVVLFGSSARHQANPHSDIDVLVLIDDLTTLVTKDMADAYRIIVERCILDVSRRLHVVTLRITTFWDYIRNGDPVGVNILRDGASLYDTGFFEPLQILLQKGKIRPTKESVWAYFIKAPATINNARWHLMQATLDLYWAVIDAAHAALMSHDAIPPTPEHVADMLDELLVGKGLLEKKYSKMMREFYTRAKSIMHREVEEVAGRDFDGYLEDASAFVERMRSLIDMK